jgi:hypothetical protein
MPQDKRVSTRQPRQGLRQRLAADTLTLEAFPVAVALVVLLGCEEAG